MKKLFLLSFFCLAANADSNAQLCELFKKSGAKNSHDMANIALMSGAVKKGKKEQIQALIQKTLDEYNKNPKPNSPVCEQVERTLDKAGILSFQSKLPSISSPKPEFKALPEPKSENTSVKPQSEVLAKPQTIAESLKGLSKADSYKIYNILKSNNYFSAEGKKENKRKEIIEIINKSLSGKSGQLDGKEIAQIEKGLKEKKFLK